MNWNIRGHSWVLANHSEAIDNKVRFYQLPVRLSTGRPNYVTVQIGREFLNIYFEQKCGYDAYRTQRIYT